MNGLKLRVLNLAGGHLSRNKCQISARYWSKGNNPMYISFQLWIRGNDCCCFARVVLPSLVFKRRLSYSGSLFAPVVDAGSVLSKRTLIFTGPVAWSEES